MKITWFGQACFLIESGKASGGTGNVARDLTVVTDPYDSKIGLTLPKDLRADVVTISHEHMDHSNVSAVGGKPTVISTAQGVGTAAVKVKGATFVGIDSFHDTEGGKKRGGNVIFKFTLPDGITFAHLGDLGHVLDDSQVERLNGIDILMIPVGGSYTIDAAAAVTVVHQIQPKIIVPMHYGVKGLGFPLDPVELFTEKLAKPVRTEDFLEITKSSLSTMEKEAEVVVLKLAV